MKGADLDSKVGLAFHIIFNSIRKVWQKQKGTHVVFAFEGRSWRKDYYEPYKRNRAELKAKLTQTQAEEDLVFWEAYDTFITYVKEKTKASITVSTGPDQSCDLLPGTPETLATSAVLSHRLARACLVAARCSSSVSASQG